MKADVYQNGKHYKIEFSRGKALSPLEVVGSTTKRGTTITFLPDEEIFETTNFNYDTMKNRFREIWYSNNFFNDPQSVFVKMSFILLFVK